MLHSFSDQLYNV